MTVLAIRLISFFMTPEQAERLLPMLVHIQANLDSSLPLELLAERAGLSPRHLHRLFVGALGETPQKYVERLRLERAALFLRVQNDSVLDIALSVGFEAHEVFTRAFRRRYHLAPRDFRRGHPVLEDSGRPITCGTREFSISEAQVVELAPRHVAFIRHLGPYEAVDLASWSELVLWLRNRRLHGEGWLGVGHDAPGITRPEQLRFDACVAVSKVFEGEGRVAYQLLPGGPHARVSVVGPLEALPAAYAQLRGKLARLREHRPVWLPIVEAYHAQKIDDVHTLLQTDIHVPLEAANAR